VEAEREITSRGGVGVACGGRVVCEGGRERGVWVGGGPEGER